jgi:hypothetical protein
MISCTEFVMAYSELFSFLEERHGRETVVRFWEELSDEFLHNLRDLVAEKGLAGMHEYWTRTLTEEGGEHSVVLTDNEFRIEMRACPSVAILRNTGHLTPYPDYCGHCAVLYRRAIEPFGFRCEVTVHDPVAGRCMLRVIRCPEIAGKDNS